MTTKELNKLTKSELIKLAVRLYASNEKNKSLKEEAEKDIKVFEQIVKEEKDKCQLLSRKIDSYSETIDRDMNYCKILQDELSDLRVIKKLASALVDKI